MSFENIMLCISLVALTVGTVGLVKDLSVKHRQREQEKRYETILESADAGER